MESISTGSINMDTFLSKIVDNPRMLLWSSILALSVVITLWRRWGTVGSEFPTINAYRWDFARKKAYEEYTNNARGLVAEGFTKVRLLVNGSLFSKTNIFSQRVSWTISHPYSTGPTYHTTICPDRLGQKFKRSGSPGSCSWGMLFFSLRDSTTAQTDLGLFWCLLWIWWNQGCH